MSVEAILAAIDATGQAEVERVHAAVEARVQQIMAQAEVAASARREAARREALRPAAAERARLLHRAKLDALRLVDAARSELVERVFEETRRRLAGTRTDPTYPDRLRRLLEEALAALGDAGAEGALPSVEVAAGDEARLRRILRESGRDLPVRGAFDGWGGVVARSADGRITVTNTLEARLERATPWLRRDLAGFFERGSAGREGHEALIPASPVS